MIVFAAFYIAVWQAPAKHLASQQRLAMMARRPLIADMIGTALVGRHHRHSGRQGDASSDWFAVSTVQRQVAESPAVVAPTNDTTA